VVTGTVAFHGGRPGDLRRAGRDRRHRAGTAHRFRNAGDTDAVFRCKVAPALEFERLIKMMFALASDGKTNRKGMPNPLQLAVIARAHFDDVRLPFPPVWMQRAGLALGAPLGRLLGYRSTYDGRPDAPRPRTEPAAA